MAKVIKSGALGLPLEDADVANPDTGFGDLTRKKSTILSKEIYDAGNEARKIVAEAELKAQSIIAEAEATAAQLIQDAETRASALKEEAEKEGFAKGSNEAAERYTAMIAEHSVRLEQKENEIAGQILQLSLAIAKKVIGRELEVHHEIVVDMAKKHLSSIRQRREVYLRVSMQDLEILREHKRDLLEQLGRAKEIEIRADETLSSGSMIIETEAGSIDAKLETQLAVLERKLFSRVG